MGAHTYLYKYKYMPIWRHLQGVDHPNIKPMCSSSSCTHGLEVLHCQEDTMEVWLPTAVIFMIIRFLPRSGDHLLYVDLRF